MIKNFIPKPNKLGITFKSILLYDGLYFLYGPLKKIKVAIIRIMTGAILITNPKYKSERTVLFKRKKTKINESILPNKFKNAAKVGL